MAKALATLRAEWPAWLCALYVAMLPWGGRSPAPMAIMALALIPIAFKPEYRKRLKTVTLFVAPLFLVYWIPIAASLPGSYDPYNTTKMTLGAVRLIMAALAIGVLLHAPRLRWRTLQLTSWILLFWCVDAFVQLAFGVDLIGREMHPDRLNALFRRPTGFGPTLAILSPLLLEYARRRWPPWAFALSFALVLGAVIIAGMRAGWMMMGLVGLVYFVLLIRSGSHGLRRAAFIIPPLFLLVFALAWAASPTVQDRLARSLTASKGSVEALDFASSMRLPIFSTSLAMYTEHPVNGVGVRAYRAAYPTFASPDDPIMATFGPATHAHNVVLEVMADSGTIGLAGLIAGFLLGWRRWRTMSSTGRQEAFPYVLGLFLILFPLNSYWSIYGSYTATLMWFLIGLWAATWDGPGGNDD